MLTTTSWSPGVSLIVGAEDTSLLTLTLRTSVSSAGEWEFPSPLGPGWESPLSKASLILAHRQANDGAVFLHLIVRHVHFGETDKWPFDIDRILRLRVGKLSIIPKTSSRGRLSSRSCRSLTRREANLLPKSLELKYFFLPAIRVFIFVCRCLI